VFSIPIQLRVLELIGLIGSLEEWKGGGQINVEKLIYKEVMRELLK
jgi:hypothetical protein